MSDPAAYQIARAWLHLADESFISSLDEPEQPPGTRWCPRGDHYAPIAEFRTQVRRSGKIETRGYCVACERGRRR